MKGRQDEAAGSHIWKLPPEKCTFSKEQLLVFALQYLHDRTRKNPPEKYSRKSPAEQEGFPCSVIAIDKTTFAIMGFGPESKLGKGRRAHVKLYWLCRVDSGRLYLSDFRAMKIFSIKTDPVKKDRTLKAVRFNVGREQKMSSTIMHSQFCVFRQYAKSQKEFFTRAYMDLSYCSGIDLMVVLRGRGVLILNHPPAIAQMTDAKNMNFYILYKFQSRYYVGFSRSDHQYGAIRIPQTDELPILGEIFSTNNDVILTKEALLLYVERTVKKYGGYALPRNFTRYSLRSRLMILHAVARAIQGLNGIVHGDLNFSNLRLFSSALEKPELPCNEKGEYELPDVDVRIIDYSEARELSEVGVTKHPVVKNPFFSPPEAADDIVTSSTDIYAFGAIAFLLFGGKLNNSSIEECRNEKVRAIDIKKTEKDWSEFWVGLKEQEEVYSINIQETLTKLITSCMAGNIVSDSIPERPSIANIITALEKCLPITYIPRQFPTPRLKEHCVIEDQRLNEFSV